MTNGRERPVDGLFDKTSTNGVAVDVGDAIPEMLVVTNHTIKVILGPDETFAFEGGIDESRATAFPLLNDLSERGFIALLDEDMDMIGHDAPSDEAVFHFVSCKERLLYDLCDFRLKQEAFAMPGIFIVSDATAEFFQRRCLGFFIGRFKVVFELFSPILDNMRRQRIRLTKSNRLQCRAIVTVRQVTSLMLTFLTHPTILIISPNGPRTLVRPTGLETMAVGRTKVRGPFESARVCVTPRSCLSRGERTW